MKTRLFRLAFRVLPHMPRPLLDAGGLVAAVLVWALAGSVRARVRANLAHLPTLAANPRALDRAVRGCFRALIFNYLDLFVPPDLTHGKSVLNQLVVENKSIMTELHQRGQGCILLALHSNGFEWGRYFITRYITDHIVAPVEVVQPPDLFALLQHERGKSGIEFLPITEGETLRRMITALRAGEHVLVTLDRDVLHSGVEMPFFGASARIPTGPVAMARLAGAPIIVLSLWRTGLRRFEGHVFDSGVTVPRTVRGDAAYREALVPLVRMIEREVLRHPEGWLAAFTDDVWVHDALPATTDAIPAPAESPAR